MIEARGVARSALAGGESSDVRALQATESTEVAGRGFWRNKSEVGDLLAKSDLR